ncbi:MAG: L-threonylcarbamoyladenylate synthase [Actinomycetota bacterium]
MSDPVVDAIAAARRGDLIVFPTDTVYGIAARPDDATATDRLFDAKRRPRDLTLPVLVSNAGQAREIARFDDRAARLAQGFWPGALTLVLPRTPASEGWDLGGDRASIGVRVPDHPLALAVLAGGALATTSANRSGEAPASTCAELLEAFGGDVEVYLCQDDPLVGEPSAVVSLLSDPPEILRGGNLDPAEIARLSSG